jgi:hypothetical protein
MIDRNNLPEWLIPKPGHRFPQGFVECAIKSSEIDRTITLIPKEQQGLK